MAHYDNAYSRLIATLKVVLPLGALAILSTVFLVSEPRTAQDTIPYADDDLDEIVRDQRISNPTYAGVTEDGTAIMLLAEAAQPSPDGPDSGSASEVIGVMETPDGGRLDMAAGAARLDGAEDALWLTGGVRVVTSTGYRATTDEIVTDLAATHLSSTGAVQAEGPPGTLTAGRLEMRREGDAYVLSFTGGVELLYAPPKD
ncbi:hypothetical protein DXV76_14295 [Rhodobacteraceae bacterium CCMM004]|nr:hypothetical protein DXV76_14295 [Rhodobacteraceae bacterium CCMM004]